MSTLDTLEQKYNFNYPFLYRELYKDGMLSLGTPSSRKENPPLLLHANDFKVLAVSQLEGF